VPPQPRRRAPAAIRHLFISSDKRTGALGFGVDPIAAAAASGAGGGGGGMSTHDA
jgi:hypothetical protein